MISFKTMIATIILLGPTLCAAQAIHVDGIVQDTAGVGISGVTVKLEMANISTTTGADGQFTFADATITKPATQPGTTGLSAALGTTSTPARQTLPSAGFADTIAVTKEGQLHYRDLIRTYDARGMVIRMIPNAGNVTDVDGNVYQSVRIGNQVWTVENLRTTKFNDGTPIPEVTEIAEWAKTAQPARCWYNNDAASNHEKYGVLYNWLAVNTGNLAPKGWHVPTDADWSALETYLIENGYNFDGSTTGNKIAKAVAAKTDWRSCTASGAVGNDLSKNNASGFSALPGGYRSCSKGEGVFSTRGEMGFWWSSTVYEGKLAYNRSLYYGNDHLFRHVHLPQNGFSVRLVRD